MYNNDYLQTNRIPQLFKALSDSLLLTQPTDCLTHLQKALNRVNLLGLESFIHETFNRGPQDLHVNPCIKGLFRYKIDPVETVVGDSVDDFRVLLLISSPGEIKPLGDKLSKIYTNCAYINLGKCIRKRIKEQSQKAICRWKVSNSLLNNGDFVPEDIALDVLLDEMKKYTSKALIIIEGYPKNIKQIKDFDNAIGLGRILKVCAIDSYENESIEAILQSHECKSGESDCRPYGVARRVAYYKAYTLPVLKYFQDINKLELVQNPKNNLKMFKQITELLQEQLPGIIKSKIEMKSPEDYNLKIQETRKKIEDREIIFNYTTSKSLNNSLQLYNIPDPIVRRFDLFKKPLVLINGPPKSGKTTLARQLCKQFPGWFHYDCFAIRPFCMDMDELKTISNNCCRIFNDLDVISSFAAGIFLENFPFTENELRIFNEKIGKIDLQIFIDVSSYNISMRYLRKRIIKVDSHEHHSSSHQSSEFVEELLKYYERIILPTIRYFSDNFSSFNVNGNQDIESITSQVSGVINAIFY